MKKFLLALLAVVPVYGISITSVSVTGTDHSSTHVSIQTDVQGFCQLKFGTSSGTYPFARGAGQSFNLAGTTWNSAEFTIGGLTPNKIYFISPRCWPGVAGDPNNLTGLVTGTEQVITTSAEPPIHPIPPTPPSTWLPASEPDTTGYTIVTMKALAGTNECVAANAVTAQTNWVSGVNINDDLQTIESKIWFKTRIQFPQGLVCNVLPHGHTFNAGVILHRRTPLRGPNDWIIVETVQTNPGDFPPYGGRIGAAYASKLATLTAVNPAMPYFAGDPTGRFNGQLFECDSCGESGWWFRNMEWADTYNTTIYPAGIVDPPVWGPFFRAIPACSFSSTANYGCYADPALTTTPHHLVLDRIYIPQAPAPNRHYACWSPGGNQWAIIGSDCTIDFEYPVTYPKQEPYVSGATITIPYYVYQVNINDTPVGMQTAAGFAGTSTTPVSVFGGTYNRTITTQPGLSWNPAGGENVGLLMTDTTTGFINYDYTQTGVTNSYNPSTGSMSIAVQHGSGDNTGGGPTGNWKVVQPVKVTFSGANLSTYSGAVLIWIDPTGVVVEYQTATGVTATCSAGASCHTVAVASPSRFPDVPYNGMFIVSGSFSSGTGPSFWGGSMPSSANPSMYQAWKPDTLFINSGSQGYFGNNSLMGGGQNIYADTLGLISDLIFEHNRIGVPLDRIQNHPTWNGSGHTVRNLWELKEGNRFSIVGNIYDGAESQENSGNVMYLAGSWAGGPTSTTSTGMTDIGIHYNIIRHVPSGIVCNGGGSANPPDPAINTRYSITQNMFIDMNKDLYALPGAHGGHAGAFWNMGCQDVDFSYNTVARQQGLGTSAIATSPASNGGGVMAEGFQYTHNYTLGYLTHYYGFVQALNGGPNYVGGVLMTNVNALPVPVQPLNSATWQQAMDGTFTRTYTSTVPNWVSANNTIVPAQTSYTGNWTDITATGFDSVATIQSGWIDSTTHIIPGATMAARMAAAGWNPSMDLTSGNPLQYRINAGAIVSGDVGANVDDVIAHAGIVTGITKLPGATYIGFNYTAPDARACNVDVSSNGTAWSRFTDAGGARTRTLTATGLTASTAYQYRLLCYFDQSAALEFSGDQLTSGTVNTLASASRTVVTGFGSLPSTATQVLVTLTPLTGSAVTGTCTTSPCSVASVPVGRYTRTVQPQTSGAVSVGPAMTSQITVQ